MKKINKYILASLVGFASLFSSCQEDTDLYVASPLYTPKATVSANDVTINAIEDLKRIKLSFNFTANGQEILLNDSTIHSALGDGDYVLQVCKDDKFETNVIERVLTSKKGDNRVALTGLDLNKYCQNLGYDMKNIGSYPVYFRIGHFYTSQNTYSGKYSDVMKVNITPVFVDMSTVAVVFVDGSGTETGRTDTLYSPLEDNHYYGFIDCPTAWCNFWLYDGLKEKYGILDGNYGTLENPNSGKDAWNFWTVDESGIFYYDVDFTAKKFSTNYVQSISANDVEMTMDEANVAYNATISDSKVTLKITFMRYTTSDSEYQEVVMYFAKDENGKLVLSNEESSIEVESTGEYVLDLSNKEYTFLPVSK